MAYEKLNWQDGKAPAVSAENLNHMDDGIASASEVANQALEAAQKAGMTLTPLFNGKISGLNWDTTITSAIPEDTKLLLLESNIAISIARYVANGTSTGNYSMVATDTGFAIFAFSWDLDTNKRFRINNRKLWTGSAATNVTGEAQVSLYALS